MAERNLSNRNAKDVERECTAIPAWECNLRWLQRKPVLVCGELCSFLKEATACTDSFSWESDYHGSDLTLKPFLFWEKNLEHLYTMVSPGKTTTHPRETECAYNVTTLSAVWSGFFLIPNDFHHLSKTDYMPWLHTFHSQQVFQIHSLQLCSWFPHKLLVRPLHTNNVLLLRLLWRTRPNL